eukprot:5812294-Prymnesium_polylepis.1
MWDYVFFRFYLEEKDPIDFTGLETYCSDNIKEQKINWLPIKKAIVIEGLLRDRFPPTRHSLAERSSVSAPKGRCGRLAVMCVRARGGVQVVTRRRRTCRACSVGSTCSRSKTTRRPKRCGTRLCWCHSDLSDRRGEMYMYNVR